MSTENNKGMLDFFGKKSAACDTHMAHVAQGGESCLK